MSIDAAIKRFEWDVSRWMTLFNKDRQWAVDYMLRTGGGSVADLPGNREVKLRGQYGLPATYDLWKPPHTK